MSLSRIDQADQERKRRDEEWREFDPPNAGHSAKLTGTVQRSTYPSSNYEEMKRILRDLVNRCDGPEGMREDGSNIDTRAAHAVLGDFEQDSCPHGYRVVDLNDGSSICEQCNPSDKLQEDL